MKQYAIMGAANPHAGPDDWTVYAVLPDMEQFQSDKWTGYVAAYSASKDEHVTWALSIPATADPADPAGWEFYWGHYMRTEGQALTDLVARARQFNRWE